MVKIVYFLKINVLHINARVQIIFNFYYTYQYFHTELIIDIIILNEIVNVRRGQYILYIIILDF